MRRLVVAALALSACTQSGPVPVPAPPVPQTPGTELLSDGATKIVAAMRARPDIDRICGGGEDFRDAMREAVMRLVISGEIEGNPRRDAEAAADFLHAHCPQPEAAPANAAGPHASPGSP